MPWFHRQLLRLLIVQFVVVKEHLDTVIGIWTKKVDLCDISVENLPDLSRPSNLGLIELTF